MKTTLVLSIAFCASLFLVSCKSTTPTGPGTNQNGTPTAVGTPIGSPVSATIDATGGTVMSPDGRLEVIIPAGALSAATPISIQPITNTAPLGAGIGFDLSPNGQKFNVPITLRFHYDANDLLGTSIYYLAVATQGDDHIWYGFKDIILDSVARTVSTSTAHFSDYCIVDYLSISPVYATVKVNTSVEIDLAILKPVYRSQEEIDKDPFHAIPLKYEVYPITDEEYWSINGNLQGNPNDGTVNPTHGASATTYTAPASTKNMSTNPVAVTVTLYDPIIKQKVTMSSNVTVIDGPQTVSGRISLSATVNGSKEKYPNGGGITETKTEDGSGTLTYDLQDAAVDEAGGDRSANWNDAGFVGSANWVSVHTTSYNYICDAVKDRIITDKETTTQTFSSASPSANITGVGLMIAGDGSYTIVFGPSFAVGATTLIEKVYSGYCVNPPPESRTNQTIIPFSQYFIPYVAGSGQKTVGKIDPAQPYKLTGTYHGTDSLTMFSYNTTTITLPLEYTITWDLTLTK